MQSDSSVLVLLNVASAFDRVDHNILIDWLEKVFGFLSGLSCGVAQGYVLGPVLFLLYLLPLGQVIQRFRDVSIICTWFDVQLYCSLNDSEFHILSMFCLTSIKIWLTINYLQLNANKTEIHCSSNQNSSDQITSWFCGLHC
uniref:Reverse transcriptase domain-containing protein n=1 Tax=Periophthalmus magnuspinnatus TaxID=409849 RepID=A0A3B3ZXJ9_9GOBI